MNMFFCFNSEPSHESCVTQSCVLIPAVKTQQCGYRDEGRCCKKEHVSGGGLEKKKKKLFMSDCGGHV